MRRLFTRVGISLLAAVLTIGPAGVPAGATSKSRQVRVVASTSSSLTIAWAEVRRAFRYRVEISVSPSMKHSRMVRVRSSQATLKRLSPGRRYYFRVAALRRHRVHPLAVSGVKSAVTPRPIPKVGPAPKAPTASPLGPGVPALSSGRVGALWISLEGTPSRDQLVFAASRYNVVVLNAWETASARLLKELNPRITVLVYKDLASTRSYAVRSGSDDAFLPSGVGYAAADPEWFATDKQGRRIEWTPYAGHWQMKVWDPGYIDAWVANVRRELKTSGVWDGVFADNDMSTLSWYSHALLEGTTTQEQSDALLRSGLDELIRKAGAALNSDGKLLVPNVSDGRLDLSRWDASSKFGGAMDENFAHWGTDASSGFVTTWGPSGWVGQTRELSAPLTLLVTKGSPNDVQAMRYGYGSALVRAEGRVVWTPESGGSYGSPEWFAWQSVNLGLPISSGAPTSSGVWRRDFINGVVLVNPTTTSALASDIGGDYCAEDGRQAGTTIAIPPHDAKLFIRKLPGGQC
jgi:hypothetical protein